MSSLSSSLARETSWFSHWDPCQLEEERKEGKKQKLSSFVVRGLACNQKQKWRLCNHNISKFKQVTLVFSIIRQLPASFFPLFFVGSGGGTRLVLCQGVCCVESGALWWAVTSRLCWWTSLCSSPVSGFYSTGSWVRLPFVDWFR